MDKPVLAVVAVGCLVASGIWGRSARYLRKVEQRLEQETGVDSDATVLARSQFRKELHTAVLYLVLALASIPVSLSDQGEADVLYAFVLVLFFLYCYPIARWTVRLEAKYAVDH